MEPTAFPLCWPESMPRSKHPERSQFKTTLAGALQNVETSLTKFGRLSGKPVSEIVLSSNCALGISKPSDPGVAAWFKWEGQSLCIAVDRYATPAENLQAIHHVLEARCTELRHGTLALVRASFQGFKALPAPPGSHWTEVLGLKRDATRDQITEAHKRLAREAHPDAGGSTEKMSKINAARDRALAEVRA